MKVLFDTSVLVSAMVDQLPRHQPALDCFVRYTSGRQSAICSTHALAETYATLTALPLPRRIAPDEARKLIEANLLSRLTVVELSRQDYESAIRRSAELGLSSGIIYDALHLSCSERSGCQRLYTYNSAHFMTLNPLRVTITSP
jgi:predicted nucleic acid-binding protein